MIAATGVLAAAFFAAVPASAATSGPAITASASGCSTVYDLPYYVCISITGSGEHVDSIDASFEPIQYTGLVHMEITGPSVKNGSADKLIKNCAQVDVTNDAIVNCYWSPNANETPGQYCSTAWQNNGGGNYTNLQTACDNVES
jgi:hypothetical protein